MIRQFRPDDLDKVMHIWLTVNQCSHHFISKHYWDNHYSAVKQHITHSNITVYESDKEIKAFIGAENGYIAGLFVSCAHQSQGLGKLLLNNIKENYDMLHLNVYQKNKRAVKFYQREKFVILREQAEPNTGELEYVMGWTKQLHVDSNEQKIITEKY